MKEEIFCFGQRKGLIGTITYPDTEYENHDLPAILLLNAGLMHRVGPYRLHVDLARKFASKGFMTFRFDMSGIGDSEKTDLLKTWLQQALYDIRETMDFLTEGMGVKSFILMGLCAGADFSHFVAASDQRVAGAVFMDGCGYRTVRYYMHYIADEAFRWAFKPSKWGRFIERISEIIKSKISTETKIDLKDVWSRQFLLREKAKTDILQMIDRGMNLLYIYSGGVREYYTYRSQFEDMFGLNVKEYKNRLQVEYFCEADHIYTLIEDRNKLINTVSNWMQSHYLDTKKKQLS